MTSDASSPPGSQSGTSENVSPSSAGTGASPGTGVGEAGASNIPPGSNPAGAAETAAGLKGKMCCSVGELFSNADWMGGLELAKQVVMDPIGVWKRVKPEPWSSADIYQNYLVPFLLIPTVAGYIGMDVLGPGSMFWGLLSKVLHYIVALIIIYGVALLMKEVANFLGGSLTLENALKMVAISSLPGFFAGAVMAIPLKMLVFIPVIASLAGTYAFYQGIPEMTGLTDQKRLRFFIVLVGTAIVTSLIIEKIF